MRLVKVIPKLFYSDIAVGLELFVNGLGFTTRYKDEASLRKFFIIERDDVTLYLLENDEFAKKDRPEIRIETDDIEALYAEIKARNSKLLHPNLRAIKVQPWGLKEFALLDTSGVCVIVHQRITEL